MSEPDISETLPGGHVHHVTRVGTTVRRAPTPRSAYVHELLALFERQGWPGAPRFLGTDDGGREIYTYLPGSAALSAEDRQAARTDETLAQLGTLVREFHDITAGTSLAGDHEVVCHNDLDPRNTLYAPGTWHPTAFIDWDLAAPGRRIDDVAHVCWQYLDLGPKASDVPETSRRLRLLCDAYGVTDRTPLLDAVLDWQDRCRRGIEAAAAAGDPAMRRLREQGVTEDIRAARSWVTRHRAGLAARL
ncbi:phosphotransferase [Streptomyces sp. NPDC052225]|uniref:phosphotransferase n=1 Tax=Streptomyces sp. NPDC052225 TaxID=3154949 RepID=UPI0034465241